MELKPCPFCGSEMRQAVIGYLWHAGQTVMPDPQHPCPASRISWPVAAWNDRPDEIHIRRDERAKTLCEVSEAWIAWLESGAALKDDFAGALARLGGVTGLAFKAVVREQTAQEVLSEIRSAITRLEDEHAWGSSRGGGSGSASSRLG
jgi:hypothetical protein